MEGLNVAQLLGQVHRDILRYRRYAVGSRRNNCRGNEARQTKQNTLGRDFGLQRLLSHVMAACPTSEAITTM